MKPPVWTGKRKGIDLDRPPICEYCSTDLELVEEIIQSKQDSKAVKEPDEENSGKQGHAKSTASGSRNPMQAFEKALTRVTELEEVIGPEDTIEYEGIGHEKRKSRMQHEDAIVKKRKDNRRGSIWNVQSGKEQVEATKRPSSDDDALEPSEEASPPRLQPTHISILRPLDSAQSFSPSKIRALPKWMAHLPSNRKSTNADFRRPLAPVRLPSQVTLVTAPPSPEPLPTPGNAYYTPLEHPAETGRVAESRSESQAGSARPALTGQLSSYPFFQNPRMPFTSAAESSGNVDSGSASVMPFNPAGAETVIVRKPVLRHARQDGSFLSMEYLEKYSQKPPKDEEKVPEKQICPVCEAPVVEVGSLEASNSKTYHRPCFRCQICHEDYGEYGKMSDWMFLKQLPYHQTCLTQRGKPLAQRLRTRASKPLPLTPLEIKSSPSSPLALAPSVPIRKSSINVLQPRPDYIGELSAFFSMGKKQQLPKFGGIIETCAGCGKGLTHLESVPGPSDTHFHAACMHCAGCGRMLEGGTSWYEWGKTGMMEPSCRKCWRGRRGKRGFSSEEIDKEEMGLGFEKWGKH
ncbi:MAG: hypothetical protein FRX48_08226 [Lasallia pustulata]|uniref:LIM zinc-binding domain-containing protein n=1 Tax=Lasallia pustulata TaxID=136370 RepID=A0A5M8PF71_9LECA|nr:MAG: hypothetical protein FRX48_08226 [Lasallia pustulata]